MKKKIMQANPQRANPKQLIKKKNHASKSKTLETHAQAETHEVEIGDGNGSDGRVAFGENGEERESRGKKIEERENIGQNERQRKKKIA